ncbi:coiled-coil domain-containing protein 137 [Pholidichthys leucotaenia]
MGKNNKNMNVKKSGKHERKSKQRLSNKKLKVDGKIKRPKEEDHLQHIPFKLREIMKAKELMKMGSVKVKKPKHGKSESFDNGDIVVPHFRRRKEEGEKAYLRRMDSEIQHVLFLSKNQLDRKPELDADKQERPANKGRSDKKKEYYKKKIQKQQLNKWDRQEDKMEKETFIEVVPFGEVAMAPPSLNIKPKKAQVKPQKAPKDLLLTSLLGHTTASSAKPSMARQRIMEEERERAVEAYRQLKRQKQRQQEARTVSLGKLKNLQ